MPNSIRSFDVPPIVGQKISKEDCMRFNRKEKRKMVESIISRRR